MSKQPPPVAANRDAEITALKHDIARYQAAASSEAEAHVAALAERDAALLAMSVQKRAGRIEGERALLARLREPDEALIDAVARVICPQRWKNLNAGEEERERGIARVVIGKITEMLDVP